MISANAALLVVDVQVGFLDPIWGKRNNPFAEQNMESLLLHWRMKRMPVFHIQHVSTEPRSPLRLNQSGVEIQEFAKPLPNEMHIIKNVNSAFIGTNLEEKLKQTACQELVIIGFTTDHCISTTTRMAANLGFKVFVVENATATFDRRGYNGKYFDANIIHQTALASLHQEFATVIDTEQLKIYLNLGTKDESIYR